MFPNPTTAAAGFHRSATANNTGFYNAVDEAVKGTRFEQVLHSNPYAQYNYQDSFWDRLGDRLGFRTQQDKVREQMELSSREYAAQAVQNMSEDQYNSPDEQAQRMREAGQNPDLLGTDGVSPATEFDQEQTSPDLSGLATSEDFVKTLVGVVGNAISIAKDFVGLQSSIQNYDSDNLGAFASALGIADRTAMDAYGMFGDPQHAIIDLNPEDYVNTPQFQSLNKRNRQRVESALGFVLSNPQNVQRYYESYRAGQKARGEATDEEASGFRPAMDESQDVWNDAAQEIARLKLDLLKMQLNSGKSKAGYENDYFGNLSGMNDAAAHNAASSNEFQFQSEVNPSYQAQALNESNLNEKQKQRIAREARSAIERLIHKWKEKSENGNPVATAALLGIGTLSYTGMPSLSSRSSAGGYFGSSSKLNLTF